MLHEYKNVTHRPSFDGYHVRFDNKIVLNSVVVTLIHWHLYCVMIGIPCLEFQELYISIKNWLMFMRNLDTDFLTGCSNSYYLQERIKILFHSILTNIYIFLFLYESHSHCGEI